MDVEPGPGWADAVNKILCMGKNNPENNRILTKAKIDANDSDEDSDGEDQSTSNLTRANPRTKPDVQKDSLLENELKIMATKGVVHLFDAVKTVNPKSDKKKKRKKKKKPKKGMKLRKTRSKSTKR